MSNKNQDLDNLISLQNTIPHDENSFKSKIDSDDIVNKGEYLLKQGGNYYNSFHFLFSRASTSTSLIELMLSYVSDEQFKTAMNMKSSGGSIPLSCLINNKNFIPNLESFASVCTAAQWKIFIESSNHHKNGLFHMIGKLRNTEMKGKAMTIIAKTIAKHKVALFANDAPIKNTSDELKDFINKLLDKENQLGITARSLYSNIELSDFIETSQAFSLSEIVSSFYESATEALSYAKDSIFSSLSPYESATEALSPAMNPVSNSLSSFRNITENNALVIENAIKIKSVSFLNKKTHSTVPPLKAAKKTYDFASNLKSCPDLQKYLDSISRSEICVTKIDNKKFVVEYKGAKTSYDKLKKAAEYCEQLCNDIDSKAISVKPYLGDKALQNINNALHITETAMHVADDVTQLFGKAMSYFDQYKDQDNNSTEWKQYTSAGLNPIIANAVGQSESNVVVAKESLYMVINIAQWQITGLGTNLIPVAQQGVVVSSAILDVDPTYSDEISLGVAAIGSVVSIYAMPASATIIAVSLLPSVASYGMKSLGYSDDYHVVTTLDTIALSINMWKGSLLLKGVSGIKLLNKYAENIVEISSSVYDKISEYVSDKNIGEIASSVYERMSEYVSDQGSAKVDNTADTPPTNTPDINGLISNNINIQRNVIKKLQPCSNYTDNAIRAFFDDTTCIHITETEQYKKCITGLLNSEYDVTDC